MASSSSTYQSPSQNLISSSKLIKQGAEAKVYYHPNILPSPTTYHPSSSTASSSTSSLPLQPLILKHRFPKTYRHPILNSTLTRTRLAFESRSLTRAQKAGVCVPNVLWVDEREGVLGLEYVEGWSVREILGGGAEGELEVFEGEGMEGEEIQQEGEAEGEEEESGGLRALRGVGVSLEDLMASIGSALARLHGTTIIHGDLTTSNMMVRLTPNASQPYEIVMIDFGLSSTAQFPEHYAVDLYVLERAFASTHPASEGLYAGVLEAYAKGLGEKKWKPIEQKLKDVRLRGRKRDMTG